MPNLCNFSMMVIGEEEKLDEFIEILHNDYDNLHMFRIFEAYEEYREELDDNKMVCLLNGECAWSVFVCMFPGEYTYYDSEKDSPTKTNILIESERLGLDIEIFSEECGMCFMEHYIIKSGELIVDEESTYKIFCTADYETVEEFNKDTGLNISKDIFEKRDYITKGGFPWKFTIYDYTIGDILPNDFYHVSE